MSFLTPEAVAKKRQLAEERARRLACHKNRTIGIDTEALNEQVKEKKERQQQEHERNDYFAEQALLMDRHAQDLQQHAEDLQRDKNKAVEDYRQTFQKKEVRREWDLNDPNSKKRDLPVRLCDKDPRLGVSSIQLMEGEDHDAAERFRLQKNQQRNWIDQQVDEKLLKKWMEKDADRNYEDRSEEMARRTWEIEQQVAAQRQQVAKTTAEFNKRLAEQKLREKDREKVDETQKKLEEIDNMLNSDFLNEIEGTVTAKGEKIKRERFKGLTDDQREAILREQASQRDAIAQQRLQDAQQDRQLAAYESMQNRMAVTLNRQRERERRLANEQLAKEQKDQAVEAGQRKKALDQMYTNQVGEEYFKPFGEFVC